MLLIGLCVCLLGLGSCFNILLTGLYFRLYLGDSVRNTKNLWSFETSFTRDFSLKPLSIISFSHFLISSSVTSTGTSNSVAFSPLHDLAKSLRVALVL